MTDKSTPSVSQTESSDDEKLLKEVLNAAQIDTEDRYADQQALTLRMWTIGITFSIAGCGLNTLFTLRSPSISIAKSTAQLLAYPAGRLWDACMPTRQFNILGWNFSLNPHPFNPKEHILIYVMANISFFTRMTADILVEQKMFFGLNSGWAFQILMILALFLIGFAFSGLTRPALVEPRKVVWPGLLSVTALTATLHRRRKAGANESNSSRKISTLGFFCLVFLGSVCWYWLPDFLFPALSYFNFPCWINPDSPAVNQVFGVSSGMGLLPLTLDWSQIAYVASPLLVPSWAIANVAIALVFWIYIVATACYYMNVWNTAYLPFQSSSIFDNTGNVYNVSRILSESDGFSLDLAKYEKYSPVYMPITYALSTYALAIATLASLIVWIILEHHGYILAAFRDLGNVYRVSFRAPREKQRPPRIGDVSTWWYSGCLLLGLFLAIFATEYWNIELRWFGVLSSFAISATFFFPVTLVYANTNLKVGIEVFCRIVGGFLWEGKILANVWFVGLGYTTILNGLSFSQDMKLCLYYHIPAYSVFWAQCIGIIIGTVGQVAVVNWALGHIHGICTTDALNGFTCPFSRTNFNTSIIWGAVGPRRFFSADSGYRNLFYLIIIGGTLPVIVHLLKRRYPTSFWRNASVPLLLGGLNYIPPATGMNYGSWAIVGLFFGYFVRKRHNRWWRRYNFVLDSALESSVSLAAFVIFFTIYYSGVSDRLSWWGTEVYKETCDWTGCPHKLLPAGAKIE
ncbi:oligopeptide transporter [Aspergillus bertholletiae]|uniref:Oligopeptide transporter n=1 Tax=Aspergillus bertholletiae TaxID=1226010 RepID=A0A5N7BI56_9EURO|nr:oligopeptide transporter [Aspergillus bertholletiae]